MSRVATLKESRTKAEEELRAVTERLEAALTERSWTDEEKTELKTATERFEQVSTQYKEAKKAEARAQREEEERTAKLGGTGSIDVRDGVVHVGGEPLTYSEANPDNSWVRDLYAINGGASPYTRAWEGAIERMRRHRDEYEGLLRHGGNSKEARAVRAYARENRRKSIFDVEQRAVSTTTGSMGDFAPPLYFLADYAPFRTYGRTFIDALKHVPLPQTGMTFNIPAVTTATEALAQTTQNTSVSTRTMVATYRSGTVQTLVDNLKVSQQYLDRVGPGIGGDQIVRDDQMRQVNRSLNIKGWYAAATASTVGLNNTVGTAVNTATGMAKFNQNIHKAKATIRKTDGTVAYPTHLITTVDLWTTVEGAVDSNNRPYVVPQGVAFNPLAVGTGTDVPEGFTGYRFAGLPALADPALYVAWHTTDAGPSSHRTQHPTLVGALDIACEWMEGTPVIRVLPQPYAATLTVLIQQFVYWAFVPVYPKALQFVYGSGTVAADLTA